mgnify:CR=1 FL=1
MGNYVTEQSSMARRRGLANRNCAVGASSSSIGDPSESPCRRFRLPHRGTVGGVTGSTMSRGGPSDWMSSISFAYAARDRLQAGSRNDVRPILIGVVEGVRFDHFDAGRVLGQLAQVPGDGEARRRQLVEPDPEHPEVVDQQLREPACCARRRNDARSPCSISAARLPYRYVCVVVTCSALMMRRGLREERLPRVVELLQAHVRCDVVPHRHHERQRPAPALPGTFA